MGRINTNIPSLQAIHRLTRNNTDLATHLQRLSTGLRINTGKDAPAALIASETLRSEINGIHQAIDNSQRANNVVNTAEGALGEVSSLLLEIQGLTNEAANTGALSDQEIEANQLQVDAILNSINRIANTTQFNGMKLLNGTLDYSTSGVSASKIDIVQVNAAKPAVDAAGDAIAPAGEHLAPGLGDGNGLVQRPPAGTVRVADRQQRWRGARERGGKLRQRRVGDVVDLLVVVHPREHGAERDRSAAGKRQQAPLAS